MASRSWDLIRKPLAPCRDIRTLCSDLLPKPLMPQALLKIMLGPVMLLQGLWVRMNTPLLQEADGPRQGRCGSGPHVRLLVVGDSSAAGVGAASQSDALLGHLTRGLSRHFTVAYRLVAQTGATTKSTLDTLADSDVAVQDIVVSALGVNDLTAGRKIVDWLADQQRLIDLLRTRYKPRVILISGLPPVHRFPALPQPLRWYLGGGAQRFNAALEKLALTNAALFLPLDLSMDTRQMAPDGFHPGPDIYAEWGRRAAACIWKRLERDTAETPVSRQRNNPPN